MLNSIEGVYRKGRIELKEAPPAVQDDTPVIVTFLRSGRTDLRERGINEATAAESRSRLSTFAEDWDSPEMDVYNEYDTFKSRL
ncbi:MAG: hypothetical protein ABII26_07570 [Pseudomonadota bacterium]